MIDNNYKITYTFIKETINLEMDGQPTHSNVKFKFDGTDVTLHVLLEQFTDFLKASGYFLDKLEIIR